MFVLLLVAACAVVPYHRPPEVAPPVAVGELPAANKEIPTLLARVDTTLAGTTETDARDRLVELRDLLVSVQLGTPEAQAAVVRYAGRVLAIEERSRPFALAESPMEMAAAPDTAVQEIELGAGDPLAAARAALAAGNPGEALTALEQALAADPTLADAPALKKTAADAWAHAEREAAGAAFLKARALPPGAERTAALRAVEARLAAINTRFPDNAYAADVTQNLDTVRKELAP